MHAPALVVIAHGSRDPRHAATVHALVESVRALRPGLRVETAFLEFTFPSVPAALRRLAAEGVRDVVAQPLLLSHAFHAKSDIPAVLHKARGGLRIRQAEVLGPSPLLRTALERRLAEAGVRRAERSRTGVVLAAAGSSDPAALAVIERLARDWQSTGGWQAVLPAYASASLPRTEDAVRELRARGAERVAVAPYVLAPGFLPDRIAAGAAEAEVLAGVLGAAPEVTRLLLRRYEQALLPTSAALGA
ncbi:sirohydrochlorin chelatase [Streptomyces physcomitrii]|uniref:Sirohydrochlorin chelatase n=1 Tax=Streptomyces physcomitrii TaxID=2724184 RepID=A0ABX1H8U6_9ACTN|nr:sirohydrochlorin chelatase [Streptomyces physcomitrii]NKI44513.1 sirohydrochlorin chelatase [Streptomyces physcomitrii]